jgi:hypothetical protein
MSDAFTCASDAACIVLGSWPWSRRLALEQMRSSPDDRREWICQMNLLWAVAFVFVMLWMVGFLAFHVTTGLIHVLLVLAVVAVVFRFVSGRRPA